MRGKIFWVLATLAIVVGAVLFWYGAATSNPIGALCIPLIAYGMIYLFQRIIDAQEAIIDREYYEWRQRFTR